ncbi:type I DNA topoisomerase [Pseudomonas helleri]|uniref:type I DNA topoisomerase n=1 Tax=Pseudomonas helleri TaxID=1608996 RepID=UPI003FD27229
MTTLIIVESPSKGKIIEEYLGSGYRVAASVGHIRDLPEAGMGVHAPDFKPEYVYTEKGREVVARLKRLQQECEDGVILATDMDREGEAIAWHLKQVLGIKDERRITYNEITPTALKKALANPRTIDLKQVAAQEARRITDRLIGYMVSPVIAEAMGDKNASTGRVQSVAVRLVDDREKEIAGHSSLNHYGAELTFGSWKASWDAKPLLDGQKHWTDKDFAELVAAVRSVKVLSCDDSESTSSPPAPFTTTTLQAAGSNALGFGPKQTMEIAQKLYEQGAITYMRTDSTALSDDALNEIFAYGKENSLPIVEQARTWKQRDDSQNAHEAVRPSHISATTAGQNENERKLYNLIWMRTVGCQLQDARFAVRVARLEAVSPVGDSTIVFEGRGKKLIYKGWKELTPFDSSEDQEDEANLEDQDSDNPVPKLTVDDYLDADNGKLIETKTKARPRYTEASLIKEMERLGIGRPATYGAVIETIIDNRNYVERFGKKKQLKMAFRGIRLMNVLRDNFQFLNYDFTKILEEQLEGLATGKANYKNLLGAVHKRLLGELEAFKAKVPVAYPCPKCSRGLTLNPAKNKKSSSWWGCSGYTQDDSGCDYMAEDADGKPGKTSGPILTEFACTGCGKPLIHRVKEGEGGWSFFGCSGHKNGCQLSFPDKNGEPDLTAPRVPKAKAEAVP